MQILILGLMEYSDFLKEIFDEMEKWDEKDLKWARDWLCMNKEGEWNVFLAGCGFKYTESSDGKDYYQSKTNGGIYFRFSEAKHFEDRDKLGVYINSKGIFERVHWTLKEYVLDDVLDKLEKINKKKPKDSFKWSR